MAKLLADLDIFSTRFDQDQQKLAEQARLIAEARAREEQETGKAAQDPKSSPRARSALIGRLQEQAKTRVQTQSGPSLETVLALSGKLRQAFDYLVDFVREFNAAAPAFGGKLAMPFAGNFPQVALGNGFVDYRLKKVNDKEVIDYIDLSYHMTSEQKPKVTINKEEAKALKLQLDRAQIKYTEREVKQFFQKVPGVELTIECTIFSRARLRPDYHAQAVDFLCQNVGTIGMASYRLPADRLNDDALEEFGKRILGLENRFAQLRL